MNRRLTIVFLGSTGDWPRRPAAAQAPLVLDPAKLRLASLNAVVVDASANRPVYAKGANDVTPIASLTKLMTAIVTLDAGPVRSTSDRDRHGRSRLPQGHDARGCGWARELPRREMLRLALMSSENRAASSLARNYPGGTPAFVAAMNAKAAALGMTRTQLRRSDRPLGAERVDGERPRDCWWPPRRSIRRSASSARRQPLRRGAAHRPAARLQQYQRSRQELAAGTSQLSKTGYIREAGKCLVMLATIASKPFVIVLLDSAGKYTRLGDAQRVRHWLETGQPLPVVAKAQGRDEADQGEDCRQRARHPARRSPTRRKGARARSSRGV